MTQSPPPASSASERLTCLPPPRGQANRLADKSGYQTPVGRLDSVTSILGKTGKNKERLEQWLKRPDAASISEQAKARGTWLHTQNENWLLAHQTGEPLPDPKHFAFGGYWRNMRPFLEKHWVQLVAQEQSVYHPTRFAGQFDCLGYCSYTQQEDLSEEEASNMLTLCDWKTSQNFRGHKNGKFKDKNGYRGDLVEDYCFQLGAYGEAISYVYGIRPERALLVIARPHGDFPDIWELTGEELRDYGRRFINRANNYYVSNMEFEP